MSTMASPSDVSLRAPLVVSFVLHALVATLFFVARQSPHAPVAPTYRVNLIAAPPAARQIGVVQPATPPVVTPPAPTQRSRATPEPERMKTPSKVPPLKTPKTATPNVAQPVAPPKPAVPAPTAGGGPVGGRGADVANVKVDGIDFPYPVYLQNVVRQIALQFKPTARGALQAEVAFLIRRDGTIAGLRLTRRSSVFSFDQDALAAVELASRAFGPLPQGFSDDVLPVIFSFDPRLIR
ncbi:MAG: TonB protein [Gemmatimonadetes bacterium]|nr:TonB protein [Gemmatimonadota bacterium]